MNPSDKLRESGEKLAASAERLRKASDDCRPPLARTLIVDAAEHIHDLETCAQRREAVATGIMTLATLLYSRVNPETINREYTDFLIDLYSLTVKECDPSDLYSEENQHFMMISMRLGALAAVTSRAFRTLRSDNAADRRELALDKTFEGAPADFWMFGDAPITPQSAIDIITDCAARLKALGLLD